MHGHYSCENLRSFFIKRPERWSFPLNVLAKVSDEPITESFPEIVFVKCIHTPMVGYQNDQRDGENIQPAVGVPIPDDETDQHGVCQKKSEQHDIRLTVKNRKVFQCRWKVDK